ncbi:hypothetical protein CI105_08515 [Candidatus Izimaplasma bacterium ZiA1]|uniref:hypothetical protein n=1 Tax=Candidatus Izimoplasma sp. ZiA1 TaxID=2024899 RepID=UPI000BAA771D|nr:hypothetical protein CI105_08515 [Candidatus Izimaplasma bacterium ZiA1]
MEKEHNRYGLLIKGKIDEIAMLRQFERYVERPRHSRQLVDEFKTDKTTNRYCVIHSNGTKNEEV